MLVSASWVILISQVLIGRTAFNNSNCPLESSFIELTDDLGITRLNNNPSTVHGNILDLVFINFEPVSDVSVKDCEFNSVHEVLDFVIRLNVKRVKTRGDGCIVIKLWMLTLLKAIDVTQEADLCSVINNATNVNESWELWLQTVTGIIDQLFLK